MLPKLPKLLGLLLRPLLLGVTMGSTATISFAFGLAPFTYQWQKDGVDIFGATSISYTPTEPGVYRCKITDAAGIVWYEGQVTFEWPHATAPSNSDENVPVGISEERWAPSISGGEGGEAVYCVVNLTNWRRLSEPCLIPGVPGSFLVYVGTLCDSQHQGNVVDPVVGAIEINTTPKTLTVYPRSGS